MRKFLAGLVVTILLTGLNNYSFGESGAHLQINKEPWTFGKIVKGEIKEKSFIIKNSGEEDLVIEKIKACCGYTVADVNEWNIPPGGTSEIKVLSDTSRKSIGTDEKKITIFSNDPISPEKKIPVFSEIVSNTDHKRIKVDAISVHKLKSYMDEGKDMVIMDVREKSEFNEKHIPGAINFPRSTMKDIDKVLNEAVQGVDKGTIISVNCGAGIRSSYVARKLREKGYNAFNLEGGIKAWVRAGYEIVVGPKAERSTLPLEIGVEEAYEHYFLLFKDKTIWIDVRDSADFKKGHIPGSRNIEIFDIEQAINSLPADKEIVFYCYGPECSEAEAAGKMLIEKGFKQGKTKVMIDGYRKWEAAGYPVAK